jgi:hypothetical protein
MIEAILSLIPAYRRWRTNQAHLRGLLEAERVMSESDSRWLRDHFTDRPGEVRGQPASDFMKEVK